jgi:uncharacterized protein YqjF (DUF2071 family)
MRSWSRFEAQKMRWAEILMISTTVDPESARQSSDILDVADFDFFSLGEQNQ